jgi:hypothetical protein
MRELVHDSHQQACDEDRDEVFTQNVAAVMRNFGPVHQGQ